MKETLFMRNVSALALFGALAATREAALEASWCDLPWAFSDALAHGEGANLSMARAACWDDAMAQLGSVCPNECWNTCEQHEWTGDWSFWNGGGCQFNCWEWGPSHDRYYVCEGNIVCECS